MAEGNKWVKTTEKQYRVIEWNELNQLKKDILWVFDENGTELHNAFIPIESFSLPYWEYLTVDGDKWFYEKEKQFYKEGACIILICMVAEYIDLHGGDQQVFGQMSINAILQHTDLFIPATEKQIVLKEVLMLGLSIAASISDSDLKSIEQFNHPNLALFYSKLPWISNNFVIPYFQSKVE